MTPDESCPVDIEFEPSGIPGELEQCNALLRDLLDDSLTVNKWLHQKILSLEEALKTSLMYVGVRPLNPETEEAFNVVRNQIQKELNNV